MDTADDDNTYTDTYTEIATNCIRFLGLSIEQIDRLTIPEYNLLMNAQELREIDKAGERHQVAWLTVSAGATRKDGRPVYKKFKDFFDYEAEIRKAKSRRQKKVPNKFSNLSKHMKEKEQCNRK